ncbi:hypothetical protein [Paenibacillus larvae]|nr:hypothetical protein [Paenibacillus larvae]AVG13013.1 hypothetical protein ERICII_02659 [Paenibacillus larvae subsp. larvae DSM 25430]MDR5568992.1 hypothetical protein [Paenibacillus larvae]MDR5596733.1 hypothetical protein [Paenibacillus larvae]
MKITFTHGEDRNECARLEMDIDGRGGFWIGCLSEDPEDAMLERNLSFVYSIEDWIKQAYEAGKNGEPLEITHENEEDEE